jgi:dolichol-phosphate mannosyltransferase
MKVLIFLPTYNEKENIAKLLDTLNKGNFNKEILIVDDNSTDGTLEIINDKLKVHKNLTLIKRTDKKGRGLAGIEALKYFIKSDANILVEMDADFSHHPKYIPNFLIHFPKYDVVIGSRLIEQGKEKGRNFLRRLISFLANSLIRWLFKTHIKDCTSGFRAFKKEVIQKFNIDEFISTNPEIVEEILYACILTNSKIKEIPIIYFERAGGESKLNLKKILFTFIGIIKIKLRGKRIIKLNNKKN